MDDIRPHWLRKHLANDAKARRLGGINPIFSTFPRRHAIPTAFFYVFSPPPLDDGVDIGARARRYPQVCALCEGPLTASPDTANAGAADKNRLME
ncbi:hypothetical protein ACOGYQ_002564 [Edwardsiella piscicida]|uniref:hypothetical protein n=1 Tax=Edwardsiella piscicida TaxID=1263550 RepID=UPI001CEDC996|nr:hypothetical protein [Edwardsiella piscicida]AOP44743.2 hypothetical protein A9797_06145 [Edwardsiella piscicida]UCQ32414.1 hypothetical protein DCF74_06310 [Edwardsiella piscicida]UCQ58734.1 hypothetical protein DCF40_06300 [Edwardsiella piscicida]